MKKLIFSQSALMFLLLLNTGSVSGSQVSDTVYHQTLRDVIKSCSSYVVGINHPEYSEKESITEYLNYLGIPLKSAGELADDILADNKTGVTPDIQKSIFVNGFNREQGVTYCAVKSAESLNLLNN